MKFLFFFLLAPIFLAAQPVDVSPKQIIGLWKGHIITDGLTVPYEIVFSEVNGKITGWSFTIFSVRGEEIVTMKKLDVSLKGFVITKDDENVFNNFKKQELKQIIQINTLSFEQGNSFSKLSGKFETKAPRALRPAKGTVFLEKRDTPDSSRLLAKLEELDLARSLSFSFTTPLVKETEVTSVAVNMNAVQKKNIMPLEKSKNPDKDPLEKTATEELIKLEPVYVAVINNAAYKTIAPTIKARQKPVVFMALIKLKVVVPEKLIAKTIPPINPEKTIAKTVTPVVPAKSPAKVIVAKTPAPVPMAKAKITEPIAKQIPVTVAVIKPTPNKLPDNIAIAPAIDLKNRKIEIIDQLTIEADSLQFTLYDNGEVDGDTVSIILNGKTIVSRQGLSTRPFTKTIYLTEKMGDSVQLIMYAENLGSIAPNTGLMIINFDKKRREVRFSGDLSKNAAIALRRKEKE